MRQVVRPARADDANGILAVVGDAFSYGATRDPREELTIVRDTWKARQGRSLIELVAIDKDADPNANAGELIGHLLAAPGRLDGRATEVAGVAPVCVAAAHQGHGIGRALMGALIEAAEGRRWPLLVLLGDPGYYSRFGFEPAGPLGLIYPPVGADNPNFQARRLPGYSSRLRGEFSYCWE